MIVCKALMVIVIMIAIPYLCGINFISTEPKEGLVRTECMMRAWLIGWMTVLGVYLPIALIVTFTCQKLIVATVIWFVIMLLLSGNGLRKLVTQRPWKAAPLCKAIGVETKIWWSIAIILIAVQIVLLIFFQHSDDDDATYVGQAMIDLYTNTIGVFGGETGLPVAWHWVVEYLVAPWPDYFATIGQLTGVAPVILMHSVVPPFLIALAYSAYHYIAEDLLHAEERKIAIFMMLFALINIFGGYSLRSPSVFLLTRVWQGKATVAAIILPLFFCVYSRYLRQTDRQNGWIVLICNCAACLGTGSSMMMTAILWFALTLADFIQQRSMKRSLKMLWVMIPNLIIILLYLLIRKGVIVG